ncbi:MAG: oligosaccharide flippase family protein, partial [Lachnospiraceae bacterium]
MGARQKKNNNSFLIQGAILATASIVVRLIGLVYRIPLTNIIGDEGIGFYSCAFEVYGTALLLSSFSLPLAVSKLVSARVIKGEFKNAFRVFKGALYFALVVGAIISVIIFFGAGFIAKHIMTLELSSYALRVLAPGLLIV